MREEPLLIDPLSGSSKRQVLMVPRGNPVISRHKLTVMLVVGLEQINYRIKALGHQGYVKASNLRLAIINLDIPAGCCQQMVPKNQAPPPRPLRVSQMKTMRCSQNLTLWCRKGCCARSILSCILVDLDNGL